MNRDDCFQIVNFTSWKSRRGRADIQHRKVKNVPFGSHELGLQVSEEQLDEDMNLLACSSM